MKKVLITLLSICMCITATITTAIPVFADESADIVIAENGTVTYGGKSASTYSIGNYYAVNRAGNFGDTIASISTSGNVANVGTSITYAGVRGIDNGESELVISSMPGGIDIENNGYIGAIYQQSSSNTSGSSNLVAQGIGDIKVKATAGTYGAVGIGIYSAGNTDITKNKISISGKSLTVESVGGATYAIQGSLAGRTTEINIEEAVTIKTPGTAYGTYFSAKTPKGEATFKFGLLEVSSSGSSAYGFHSAGGANIDVELNGNMNVNANSSATGFRAAGNTSFDVTGKNDNDINITSTGKDGYGAYIGGNGSTANLFLEANKFIINASKEAYGLYMYNAGTSFSGKLNKLSAVGGTNAYAIYTDGGVVTIKPNSNSNLIISASGTNGKSYSIYVKTGGTVNLTNAEVYGDISNDTGTVNLVNTYAKGNLNNKGTINLDYNCTIEAANVSNSGSSSAIVVDMTGATENRYTIIKYCGNENPSYGTEGTNYKFAEGKDNGYVFEVKDKNLYAIKVLTPAASDFTFKEPTSCKYDGNKKEATLETSENGIGNVSLLYSLSGTANWTKEVPEDAGTYYVKADIEKGECYKSVSGLSADSWHFTIEKRDVTLTSASAYKKYDNAPLTSDNVKISGDGFVGNEGITYSTSGSQTNIGTSNNYFSYELNSDTKERNYNIEKVFGTLTVYPEIDTSKSNVSINGDELSKVFFVDNTTAIVVDFNDTYSESCNAVLYDKNGNPVVYPTCESGSIKITIPNSFIKTLDVGTHYYDMKITNSGNEYYIYDVTIIIKEVPKRSSKYATVNTSVK